MKDIMVSVNMVAYNHEKYIAQAIEGVLMQKTTFPIELVIGEDCSPDRTRQICIEYRDKYPDIIKLLLPEKNIGSHQNGVSVLLACTGKYIAACEGDDYWTDPHKLQKQVDFLEANPEYSACAHQSMTCCEYRDQPPEPYTTMIKDKFVINDLFEGCQFHLATIVIKYELMKKTIDPPNIISGDRFLFLISAMNGPIKYLPETMSVYRINRSSISTWITPDLLKRDLNMVPWFVGLFPDFPKYRCLSFIHKTIIAYPSKVPFFTYLKHYFIYAWYSFSFFPKNLPSLFSFTFLTTPKFAVLRLFPNLKWKRLQSWR